MTIKIDNICFKKEFEAPWDGSNFIKYFFLIFNIMNYAACAKRGGFLLVSYENLC